MLGDFIPEPQGRVTLTPSEFSQLVARVRVALEAPVR